MSSAPEETAIIAVTRNGAEIGRRLQPLLPNSHLYLPGKFTRAAGADVRTFSPPAGKIVEEAFGHYRYLVLVMAVGAAVRLLASRIKDKHEDPGVVVVDESGKFAVSLLSGHAGGANELAEKIASCLGAQPVITTASDIRGLIAVDLIGEEFDWELEDCSQLTAVSAAVVNGEPVGIYQDAGERSCLKEAELPDNVRNYSTLKALNESGCGVALFITDRLLSEEERFPGPAVIYRPKSLVLGIGCNRGTGAAQIEEAVTTLFRTQGLSFKSVRRLATVDAKRDEAGLLEFARKYSLPIDFFESASLNQVVFPSEPSEAALKHVGTSSVCEAAAILSGGKSLVVAKTSFQGAVTLAIGRLHFSEEPVKGRLFIVGIGPGFLDHMTLGAREAIRRSRTVAGYQPYIKLIQPLLEGKECISTGMGDEVRRARSIIELAEGGRTVSIVCSGDAGIYGMAGLVLEIMHSLDIRLDVEIVPGVPSVTAVASLLGAPIMTDFVVISLSDYLVRWKDIARRLDLAAQGDFVIIIMNPRSKKRRRQLVEARHIILKHRAPATPAGIVMGAYRDEQRVVITDLEHLLEHEIDMNTTLIIGNSQTFVSGGRMVTPRGYHTKYDLDTGARR